MKTTEFLDAVRARHGLKSDYRLAKFLAVPQTTISNYRTRKSMMDEAMCLKVAAALELDPGQVLAAIAAERAKAEEVKSAWSKVAAQLAKVACLALVAGGAGLHNRNVQAAGEDPSRAGPYYTYAPNFLTRLARWAQAPRSGLSLCLRVALVLSALAAAPAHAAWTGSDTAWEAGFLTVLSADCLQTWHGSGADPAHFEEANPLLPAHPSKSRIAWTCAAVGGGHIAVSALLPGGGDNGGARRFWQIATTGVEIYVVANNYFMAGVKISF